MNTRILALTALALVTLQAPARAAAPASPKDEVVAAVHQFVDGFNKGDTKMLAASCAEETAILDEFPPHAWQGKDACTRWAADYDADAKKNGITDGVVTLGRLKHVEVSGDHAYVVGPADYAYRLKGKPVKETGSTFTLALQKGAGGWRITGWAWAKH